jgi:hypothetical protein
MSITFKQFTHLVEMSDEEFAQVQEGLSDIPGFGWLKGPDTAAKKQKIDQARKQLQARKDTKSKERAAELDAALLAFKDSKKPQKPGEVHHDDLDRALSAVDRKFNAKMDRMRNM